MPTPHNASRKPANKKLVAALLKWFAKEKRQLPWRATRDPYQIWIAEVMLQQTRVATVIPYYQRFLEIFPTVESLANAEDGVLMKAWEGLGYYARAQYLRDAAQTIVAQYNGKLPTSREALLQLKGFGAYTSASVASLAFNQDCAAVDGNVMRVLSRVFAIESDTRKPAAKREFQRIADALVPTGSAGQFNEALMDLGATVCKPKKPTCEACPLIRYCRAYQEGRVHELPLRSPQREIPHHHIAIGVVHKNGRVLIALRPKEGLLGNLWEFPGGKLKAEESLADCCRREVLEETNLEVEVGKCFSVVRHSFSHFRITLHAFHCRYERGRATSKWSQKIRWVKLSELADYAFPTANKKIIADLSANPRFTRD
ncbi:MAG: A/G-specific adenine glycosylase [Acidobacteria bacterium]|nr:A/G-specific adenine glycosylase [Acidobacteriota bacterium]